MTSSSSYGQPSASRGGGPAAASQVPNPNVHMALQAGPSRYLRAEVEQPLAMEGIVELAIDRNIVSQIDTRVCNLQDNMPQLHKGRIVAKPSHYILAYQWRAVEAPRFFLDMERVSHQVLDHTYVKQVFLGPLGLYVHVWKQQALLDTIHQESSGPPDASAPMASSGRAESESQAQTPHNTPAAAAAASGQKRRRQDVDDLLDEDWADPRSIHSPATSDAWDSSVSAVRSQAPKRSRLGVYRVED